MKTLIVSLFAIIMIFPVYAQPDTTTIIFGDTVKIVEEEENQDRMIEEEEVVVAGEQQDTTRIKIGNKGITVIEGPDGTQIDMKDLEDKKKFRDDEDEDEDDGKFKPHWAGFEWGINNFVNSDFSMNLGPDASFMDLRTSRSWNINLNFIEHGFGLGTDKLGLVTGLGLEWNNYHFTGDNNITVNDNDMVVEYVPGFVAEPGSVMLKSKLRTTYLTAPLLLEGQIPAGDKRVYISAGVVGGVKIGSKTKMVYEWQDSKQKDKVKDDFNLSLLRYGFTARLGYSMVKLYATWYPTSFFVQGKGPEIYPFQLGLTLINF